MKEQVIERLIRYVKIDTQSDDTSNTVPSTAKQWDLLTVLEAELKEIGMSDVSVDDHGYLFATLPANTTKAIPTVGFLAHVDTTTDFTGTNVKPQRIDNYDGGNIKLNEHLTLSPKQFPELTNYIGQTLITTDGTTLLGADDKAGIAEIMTAMEYFIKNPDIKHGKIRVAFTPDEEIGRGPHAFDVARFDADYAYTMDGGPLGELEFESFNAAGATITTFGTNVHPGSAKNKMVNSITAAIKFQEMMPKDAVPELTSGYEGFIHLMNFDGSIEKTTLSYIVRDHDREKFEAKKELIKKAVTAIQAEYGEDAIQLDMNDQYYNMAEKIVPVKFIVDIAEQAMKNLNIKADIKPIRGGTDGSQLSFMGLPTPNIFAGGENMHGKYEYVSGETMEKATEVLIEIVKLYEQN
ncbi:peptidase T [Kurthia sibirica]|uniref:Peptidase T n=1 Tax=Kurthia sibirica TaxID=202750 RepID=A0A2U3AQ79_9BACL|nr:peptidase T [Kurthia sibirica]PWI26615.1 peptidase T [Kurthia sibirica]GEK32872.1 peptidase T [Kurthia sibirica]